MNVEILDTTLRDGEQTSGVSFSASEKLSIVRLLLEELHIPRIEIASARVSEGEFETVRNVCAWAERMGHLDKLEVLGFIDNGLSIDWVKRVGAKVINLLSKGSEKHCLYQLKKTPQEHFDSICSEVEHAVAEGLDVNLYLEDWSNGIKNSYKYVYELMDAVRHLPIKRYMLPDTLGILNPYDTLANVQRMIKRYPDLHFDFHAHNDYDLAT